MFPGFKWLDLRSPLFGSFQYSFVRTNLTSRICGILAFHNYYFFAGPSNWAEVGGTPESMWTPNSKQVIVDF